MIADTNTERLAEAQEGMDASAKEMGDRVETLGAHIEEAKKEQQRAKDDPAVPTAAAADWEDTAPEDSTGEDPSGFDDPESEEEEEEE